MAELTHIRVTPALPASGAQGGLGFPGEPPVSLEPFDADQVQSLWFEPELIVEFLTLAEGDQSLPAETVATDQGATQQTTTPAAKPKTSRAKPAAQKA